MAYKEKLTWLYLSGMVICFGAYFIFLIATPQFYDWYILDQIKPLAILGSLNAVIVLSGLFWLMKTHPKEERHAKDERDFAIDAKATRLSYNILIYGTLFVGGILPFTESAWKVANCAMFAVCIAEVVRGISTIKSYRAQRA